ncbi:MAG: putative glutamine amidotransferase [Gemmatimonadaceae bacterium]|nr:putative glutamine amidotransferase [Gemmatimonadaceae bacterium]
MSYPREQPLGGPGAATSHFHYVPHRDSPDPTSRMRPIVAVSATSRPTEGAERVRLNEAYVSALHQAGVIPLILPPLDDTAAVAQVLGVVDGLVLSGGEDIDPIVYGAERHPATGAAHESRDNCELALARTARAMGLPTLAICRGIQVLNVALGGTLIQDIPSQVGGAQTHDGTAARTDRVHRVSIFPGTRLAGALESHDIAVNSVHHQALDRVAADLRVSARADDGVIEGVESCDPRWFALGVQWHPEELTRDAEAWDRRLFSAFAAACRERAASRKENQPLR